METIALFLLAVVLQAEHSYNKFDNLTENVEIRTNRDFSFQTATLELTGPATIESVSFYVDDRPLFTYSLSNPYWETPEISWHPGMNPYRTVWVSDWRDFWNPPIETYTQISFNFGNEIGRSFRAEFSGQIQIDQFSVSALYAIPEPATLLLLLPLTLIKLRNWQLVNKRE